MKQNKYRKGKHIISFDELMKQDFVYFDHKIYHSGWFGSWKLRFAKRHLGENGRIFYAEKIAPDTLVCNKCGRRFTDESELKLLIEVQKQADDIYTVDYDEELSGEPGTEIIKACPNCRTDAYLMDLEVDE